MPNDEAQIPERVRAQARALWEEAGRPESGWNTFIQQARSALQEDERLYDKTLPDSYPASDPPANSGITGPGVDE